MSTIPTRRYPRELVKSPGFLLKRLGFAMKEKGFDALEPTGFTPYHQAVLTLLN